MDFEVQSDRTKPALDLDTIRLRDPTCKPVFKSLSNDMVRFHVPLNRCGTRQRVSVRTLTAKGAPVAGQSLRLLYPL